jgi:hypothetical protein
LSEEYDLKKSENKIGQLYPVLVTKDGKIIDGFHRKDADPNWKTMVVPEIDDEEKLLAARLIANFHRRQVSKEEKEEWINGLAQIYKAQGLGVSSIKGDGIQNEIKQKIMEVTGLSESTVSRHLANEFKSERKGGGTPEVPVSEKVEKVLGEKGVAEYKRQVVAESKLTPQEKAALTRKRQQERAEKERKAEIKKRERDEKKKLNAEKRRKEAEEREAENQKRKIEQERLAKEKQCREEEKRKQLEEKIRKEVAKRVRAEVKQELLKDKAFQQRVIEEVRKPRIVKVDSCVSGVCDLPSKVESGPPLDVRAEAIAQFFLDNTQCQCKHCVQFQKCGVIY